MGFPQIDFSSWAIMLLMAAGYASWKLHQAQTKIFCVLRRADNSVDEGFANWTQHKIALKTGTKSIGWFDVDQSCVQNKILNKGFPFFLFPTRVAYLDYVYTSSHPIDPKTFKTEWPNPEARRDMDKANDIQAYNEGSRKSIGSTKKTPLEQWMPILTVGAFLIMGYFIWEIFNKVQQVGSGNNAIYNQIADLQRAVTELAKNR